MGERTIVIGDVHGCLEELDELLGKLEVRAGAEQLVLVGDLLDFGPDGAGVVRRVRELGALAVLGNHDEKHLRFARHEARRRAEPSYRNPMTLSARSRAQHDALSEDDLAFLAELPSLVALEPPWVVVHAGFSADVPMTRQEPSVMLRIRDVDAEGRAAMASDTAHRALDTVPWATRWPGPQSVVYGHVVHDLERPRLDQPRPGVRCWGIDTGCCFGGHLTALVLPDEEIVQVRARRAYAERTTSEDG